LYTNLLGLPFGHHFLYNNPLLNVLLGNDINSKAFVTTRAQLREENKQVQRAGKNVEKWIKILSLA
jgi:hypothetical protein